MSSDDSMPAMPTALVYIQDVDSDVGRHLAAAISARNAFWDGGAEIPAADDTGGVARRLVVCSPAADASPADCVADADVVVVNLFGDLDRAAALIKAARAVTLTGLKHVVCLSTALTWAAGRADGAFDEAQFRARQPAPAAARHKLLETLVVNSARDTMATAVIAAGILYGDGECDLHPLFKQAWLGAPAPLPIIGSGANILPTIHIADFAAAAVRFLERPPPGKPYVLAVDNSRDTQQAIVTAIAQMLSTGATTSLSELDAVARADVIAPHIATANVVVARDASWIASLDMEWRCEQGLVASVVAVVDEYVAARNLHPVRVAVVGPPTSGRTYWARRIAARFYLPLVSVRDLIATAKQGGVDLQLDKNGRAPVTVLAALVKAELNRNEIRNKGYVLDGYPRTSEEARATFDPAPPADPPAADQPDPDADAKPTRRFPIGPDRVLALSAPDAVVLGRVRDNAAQAIAGHSDEKGAQRRLNAWNKAAIADNNPRAYFTSGGVEVLDVNAADPVGEVVHDLVDLYVAGPRPSFNYHPTDDEIAAADAARRERERAALDQALELERQQQLQRERDAEERARKAAERHALLRQLAQAEADLVAERARPLRQYLDQHVVPVVVDGLYEIARVRPDDPVDYLADFLFRASTAPAAAASQ